MSWLASLLGKILPGLVVDATTRLVNAARESLRPSGDCPATRPEVPIPPAPPPIGATDSGARQASEYLRGYGDATWKRHMDERNAGSAERLARAVEDEPVEAEKPSDGEGER